MIEIKKDRSITKLDADIKSVLDFKLAHYQENNIPIGVISDYIYKGVEEVDAKIEQLKNYKKMIDEEIKDLGTHKDTIKIKSAEWLVSNGLDKLEGIEVSSITLTKFQEAKTEQVIKKDFVCSLSTKEINDILVMQDLASYDKKEETKITPEKPVMIKINKRRTKK